MTSTTFVHKFQHSSAHLSSSNTLYFNTPEKKPPLKLSLFFQNYLDIEFLLHMFWQPIQNIKLFWIFWPIKIGHKFP